MKQVYSALALVACILFLSGTANAQCLTAPFTESFNTSTQPGCILTSATTGSGWDFTPTFWNTVQCSAASDHTGNGGDFVGIDHSGSDAGTILEFDTIDVSTLTTPYLSFYYFMCPVGYSPLNILFVEAYDGAGGWTQVDMIQEGFAAWTEYTYDLSSYTFGTNHLKIRFRGESGGSGTDYYGDQGLDDISVVEAPTCLKPVSLTSSSSAVGSADLSWTEVNTAPQWQIEYGPVGFSQGSGTVVLANSNPYNLSPLTETMYEFYVRSICTVGDTSAWSSAETFCVATDSTFSTIGCDAYTVPSGNATYLTSGTYFDTITNMAGCDSLLTINVTINSPSASSITVGSCDSYTVPSGNATYTASGIYNDTITNAAGCDSVITIDLTISGSTTAFHVVSACDSYTVPSGSITYFANGIFNDTIPNSNGCDSIMTFALTVYTLDQTLSNPSPTELSSNEAGATYQWLDCDNGYSTIAGETNQDFTATANGSYAVEISEHGCIDTSVCSLITQVGIESLIRSQVQIYPNPSNGQVNIELGSLTDVSIHMTTITGKTVFQSDNINNALYQLDLDVAPGIYSISVRSQGQEERYKIMIKE